MYIIIFWLFPPKLENREEFEGGLKNRKNLKKPGIKVPKNREEFSTGGRGGEQFFWLARIYTPGREIDTSKFTDKCSPARVAPGEC